MTVRFDDFSDFGRRILHFYCLEIHIFNVYCLKIHIFFGFVPEFPLSLLELLRRARQNAVVMSTVLSNKIDLMAMTFYLYSKSMLKSLVVGHSTVFHPIMILFLLIN